MSYADYYGIEYNEMKIRSMEHPRWSSTAKFYDLQIKNKNSILVIIFQYTMNLKIFQVSFVFNCETTMDIFFVFAAVNNKDTI
jgi:hypothetical protein